MLDNLICYGIALTGFERLHRSLDAGCWMLASGHWQLVGTEADSTCYWLLDARYWFLDAGLC